MNELSFAGLLLQLRKSGLAAPIAAARSCGIEIAKQPGEGLAHWPLHGCGQLERPPHCDRHANMPPELVGVVLSWAKAAEETAVTMAIARRVVFFIVLISYNWVTSQ